MVRDFGGKIDLIDRKKRVEIILDFRYLNMFWISIFDFNYYVQMKPFQNFSDFKFAS